MQQFTRNILIISLSQSSATSCGPRFSLETRSFELTAFPLNVLCALRIEVNSQIRVEKEPLKVQYVLILPFTYAVWKWIEWERRYDSLGWERVNICEPIQSIIQELEISIPKRRTLIALKTRCWVVQAVNSSRIKKNIPGVIIEHWRETKTRRTYLDTVCRWMPLKRRIRPAAVWCMQSCCMLHEIIASFAREFQR